MLCTFLWNTLTLCRRTNSGSKSQCGREETTITWGMCLQVKGKPSKPSATRNMDKNARSTGKHPEVLELFSRLGLCACYRFKQSLVSGVAVILGPRHHYWHRFAYPTLILLVPERGGCGAQAESGGRCFRKEGLLPKSPRSYNLQMMWTALNSWTGFLVDFMLMLFLAMLGKVVDICNFPSISIPISTKTLTPTAYDSS